MTIDVAPLEVPSPPWFYRLAGELDARDLEQALADEGITARTLDGAKMTTLDELFAEVSTRFEFPDYFGWSWPALDECIADLSWLPGFAYALVLTNASQLLTVEPIELPVFVRVLISAAEE